MYSYCGSDCLPLSKYTKLYGLDFCETNVRDEKYEIELKIEQYIEQDNADQHLPIYFIQ